MIWFCGRRRCSSRQGLAEEPFFDLAVVLEWATLSSGLLSVCDGFPTMVGRLADGFAAYGRRERRVTSNWLAIRDPCR